MLQIDLTGKRAFVAGVSDDQGFGFAIAKHLAMAGASVCIGTWPPTYNILTKLISLGKIKQSLALPGGGELVFERIYPFDADFDTYEDMSEAQREDRRYKAHGDVSVAGTAQRLQADFGDKPLDIVVHSLANGPEVKKALVHTSRKGYLAAVGTSAYSFVSLVSKLGPLLRPQGSFLNLTFMASERVIPGYGGGMSSAKAALESDTRTLAFEAGRLYGARVNSISAGAWGSRAASAIGLIERMIEYGERNAPLPQAITPAEVGATAAFMCSPLGAGITGTIVYVDKGMHTMGIAVDAVPDNLHGQ
ncbi:MAG TPA: enoyl-[acyl-carrier-protein] reductase [Polyangiales bacterium]|nr:enoyl-[acyl-carrier-protein] reductase [Polyangiales bacterium]